MPKQKEPNDQSRSPHVSAESWLQWQVYRMWLVYEEVLRAVQWVHANRECMQIFGNQLGLSTTERIIQLNNLAKAHILRCSRSDHKHASKDYTSFSILKLYTTLYNINNYINNLYFENKFQRYIGGNTYKFPATKDYTAETGLLNL